MKSSFDEAPVIIGHRGASGLEPENTLPSFRTAVALGVQAVELDVHLCDGQLVVIHDPTLERTTNGTGEVSRMPFAALRKLDAGAGALIPTLTEVVDLLPETTGLNVELKGAGTAAALADWLPAPGERPILVSSFDHTALRRFCALRNDYPAAPLFGRWQSDALQIAAEFGSGYVNLGRKLCSRSRLQEIRSAGFRPLVYTVNDLKEARRLVVDGAWGLFTDYPDRINRDSLGSLP